MIKNELENNKIYRVTDIRIRKNDSLFLYCDRITGLANNLMNAVRFRQRQVFTALNKDLSTWTGNERGIMDEIRAALPHMKKQRKMPGDGYKTMGYAFLDDLMKVSGNPDYFASGLPRQTAQQAIKHCVAEWKAGLEAIKAYRKTPGAFTGKPELAGYRKKGGHTTAIITNQDGVFKLLNGRYYLKLPLTDIRLEVGRKLPKGHLMEVRIVPDNGTYRISLVMEVGQKTDEPEKTPSRIAAIDFGVDNLMAVTNNCGLPCFLYRGGMAKSANQEYNKAIAMIMSGQTIGSTKKFVPTDKYYAVTLRRNDRIKDFMHKTAKRFITWCVENRIDTVVCGVNRGWKQEISIGHVVNQKFVQIPHCLLRGILHYLCDEHHIGYVEQEESYTSKASFRDGDPIPVYKKGDISQHNFSGRRRPTVYKGMHKDSGFRGLYRDSFGIINSDLNGSANILRKAFPNAFTNGIAPLFDQVIIVKHPDQESRVALQAKQKATVRGISKAKAARHARKAVKSAA